MLRTSDEEREVIRKEMGPSPRGASWSYHLPSCRPEISAKPPCRRPKVPVYRSGVDIR